MIGVPAIVVPAGFYSNGLPFGLASLLGVGATEICSAGRTVSSRRLASGGRLCWWRRACSQSSASVVHRSWCLASVTDRK